MKKITLFIFILTVFIGQSFGQISAKPKIATPREVEAEMSKFAPFVGEFETTSKLFNAKTGEIISDDSGTIICRYRSFDMVFTIEKTAKKKNGKIYDDIMVFQYDAVKRKMSAVLYSPDAVPRNIEVEIKGNIMTLIYEPYLNGNVTKEIITVNADKADWLIERRQTDGSFRKTREILAVRKK